MMMRVNQPDGRVMDRSRVLTAFSVSRETAARLDAYVALLLEWQPRINLVASSTVASVWQRHIADSLQLLRLETNALIWADLGAGGGIPGLPLACALAERPGAHVYLVERNTKKSAFLREAVRVTGVPATVFVGDIANFGDSSAGRIECVTARALAPIGTLFTLTAPFLEKGAHGLFLKGAHLAQELTEAETCWDSIYDLIPSMTGDGFILHLRSLKQR